MYNLHRSLPAASEGNLLIETLLHVLTSAKVATIRCSSRSPDQTQMRAHWHHCWHDLVTDAPPKHYPIRASIFIVRCEPEAHERLKSEIRNSKIGLPGT